MEKKNALGLSSNSNKTKEVCLVTTSKWVYLQENHVIILILTYYFLLLLIIKVHYSQLLYVIFQKLSICSYYLCLIDIFYGNEVKSKVISQIHFLVSPNITQDVISYIKIHVILYSI